MFYYVAKFFGFFFYKTFYWIKVFGKENRIKGKCIVACNHLGKADVLPISYLYRGKTIFMSKVEWYDNNQSTLQGIIDAMRESYCTNKSDYEEMFGL